jgi:hypothetical protein
MFANRRSTVLTVSNVWLARSHATRGPSTIVQTHQPTRQNSHISGRLLKFGFTRMTLRALRNATLGLGRSAALLDSRDSPLLRFKEAKTDIRSSR